MSRLPKSLIIALCVVVVAGAGLAAYLQLRPAGSTGAAQEETGMVFRKCSACGAIAESAGAELRDKGYLDLEGVGLLGDGAVCPKCRKATLKLARRCPKDGTVFVPDVAGGIETKAAHCPKCNWNPFAE